MHNLYFPAGQVKSVGIDNFCSTNELLHMLVLMVERTS